MELWEKLKEQYRACERQGKKLLLIYLGEHSLQVALQDGEVLLWQEECELAEGEFNTIAYWAMVQEQLRKLLLAHDVEDKQACFLVLTTSFAYEEELELPKLKGRNLQATLAWEAQECVPWEAASYEYSVQVLPEAEEKLNYKLQAVPLAVLEEVAALNSSLLLQLGELRVAGEVSWQEWSEAWYRGSRTQWRRPEQNSRKVQLLTPALCQLYRLVGITAVVLSVLLSAGVYVGLWLAERDLSMLQDEAKKYEQWEERRLQLQAVERELKLLQREKRELAARNLQWSQELQTLAKTITPGCWLTAVESLSDTTRGRGYRVKGGARDLLSVQLFAANLEASRKYEQVELEQCTTVTDGSRQEYALKVLLKPVQGGKDDAKAKAAK